MKNKIIYLLFILLIIISLINLKTYATEENLPEDTTESNFEEDMMTTEDTSDSETVAYRAPTSNGSSYVTSVSTLSTQYQSNLNLNNILSILLIAIGLLLVLFSMAILIRLKK